MTTKSERKTELIARMRNRQGWRPSNAQQTKRVAWAKEYSPSKYDNVNSVKRVVYNRQGQIVHESTVSEIVNENLHRVIDQSSIVR